MYLIEFDGKRDNNFTIVRLLLAWMVIVSHAFVIQKVDGVHNPLYQVLQGSTSAGQLAVDGFFAISGFLVTMSLVRRGVLDYSISRSLRIFPGLIVCIALTTFIIGPIATSLSAEQYFSHSGTFDYLYNALAFPATRYILPGVFTENSTAGINGSLWSISWEVKCYAVLAIIGITGLFRYNCLANIFSIITFLVLLYSYIDINFIPGLMVHIWSALAGFGFGVVVYFNRQRIPLNAYLAIIAAITLYFSFGQP